MGLPQAVRNAAPRLGLTVFHAEHTPTNYADAFALMTRDRPDALFVAYHPTNYVDRQRIADLELRNESQEWFPTEKRPWPVG